MAASAAAIEATDEAQALDYAVRAAKLQPQFTPSAVIASRLLNKTGKPGRAEDVLEAAWAAAPHPALWLAYRDLVSDETPRERARRLQGLIDRNPKHRESRILQVERTLLTASKPDILVAMEALDADTPEDALTKRVCGVLARAASALQDQDAARGWIAKAALAKPEPEWSDIDADGRAFAYGAQDWSDLILTFAGKAALIHPRFDRGEKGLPELPDLASRYVPSMPFIKASRRPHAIPLPDDPGVIDAEAFDEPMPVVAVKAKPARKARAASPKAVK